LSTLQAIFDRHDIVGVFHLLGEMSMRKVGSIAFWKRSIKFVTETLSQESLFIELSGDEQKKFVINLFKIFINRRLSEQTEEKMVDLAMLALVNYWNFRDILLLTTALSVNRVGHNELWFAIEKKIDQINLKNFTNRGWLKGIIKNFNAIGKGSYYFWQQMNRALSDEEKNDILS
jgi:hypothetical protein